MNRVRLAASTVVVLAGLVPAALVLAASNQEGGEGPLVVQIQASDFSFVVDRTIIPRGPVQFVVTNLSQEYKHEVWIYPIDERDSPRFHEMLALKRSGQRADEPSYVEGIVGRSGEVPAGNETSFVADLPPGVYEIGCLAREGTGDVRMVHHDEGMFAALAVRASWGT